MNPSDTLSNVGTSKVFLALLKGKKSPKIMADFLGIKPSPAIQQLRRLQKIGIVKLGGKQGKEQNYEIRWKEFLALFIDIIIQQRAKEKDRIEEDQPEQIEQIKALSKNKYFKQSIEAYLKATAECKPSEWTITIENSIVTFEKTLLQAKFFEKEKAIQDAEKRDFFNKMKLWRSKILRSHTWRDVCFNTEIEQILKE